MSSNYGVDKDSFTFTLVSSASMIIFIDNWLASFKNRLSEDIELQGEWRVITFPTYFNKVTDTKIYKKDKVKASLKVSKDKTWRSYDGETGNITKGDYDEFEKLFDEINRLIDLDNLSFSIDPITKHLSIWMHYWEKITFEKPKTLSILGFKGIRDGRGYHIGYKESSHIHSTLTSQNFISDYPVNILAGTQMMFIYLDMIRYQFMGDTKAPLLRVIDSNRRVKKGYASSIELNHRKIFINLD